MNNVSQFFVTVIYFAPKFIPGVLMTLKLSCWSIVLGTGFGLITAIFKLSHIKPLEIISKLYVTVVRGTPLLLQLIFIFYGLPQMGLKFNSFTSAVIGLAFHNGAYISEIFRGAIESIEHGQLEAGRALGMTKWEVLKRIILPQAFKRSVPALGNQFIIGVKDSSLASAITISETLMLSRQFVAATYNVFPIFFIAGCYYLLITIVLERLLNQLEKRLKVYD
ncbi:amino acid ABC transporter permease [Sporomusa ovata]|uniref:Putative transport system permease protein n=1 Tax=Sporomusa ovata TaxID=2378 RepID=A0A0U1KZT7_9FIRM|nr:amino acid ABC transporter permease [Sporomusa ovata]CQR72930.1 Putative transport system permease protein [Sporomusa ovata]